MVTQYYFRNVIFFRCHNITPSNIALNLFFAYKASNEIGIKIVLYLPNRWTRYSTSWITFLALPR